jgi:hypothetical protein
MDPPPPGFSGQASVSSPARTPGGGGGLVQAPYWSPARVAMLARDRVRSQRCQSPFATHGLDDRPTGPFSGSPGRIRKSGGLAEPVWRHRHGPGGPNILARNVSPRPREVAALSATHGLARRRSPRLGPDVAYPHVLAGMPGKEARRVRR